MGKKLKKMLALFMAVAVSVSCIHCLPVMAEDNDAAVDTEVTETESQEIVIYLDGEKKNIIEGGSETGYEYNRFFSVNGSRYCDEGIAADIAANAVVINNTNGIYADFEVCHEVSKSQVSGHYGESYVCITSTLLDTTAGKSGSFTVRYRDYEETFYVEVIDYDTTIKKMTYGFTSHEYSRPFDYEEDGTILIEGHAGPTSYLEIALEFENMNRTYMSQLGYMDGSLFWIDEAEGIEINNYDDGHVPEQVRFREDGLIGLALLSRYYYGERPLLYFDFQYEREAWFTLHYGEDYSWRFHVVTDNPYNYAADAQITASSTEVATGEEFTLHADVLPEGGYYKHPGWRVYDADDKLIGSEIGDGRKGTMFVHETSDTDATAAFFKPGTYKVVFYMATSADGDYIGQDAFSHPLYITVTGDEVEASQSYWQYYEDIDNGEDTGIYSQFAGEWHDDSELHLLVYKIPADVTNVTADIWCETDGDDDLRTYSMWLSSDGTYYMLYIYPKDHNETGIYHARVYGMVDGVRTLLCEDKHYVMAQYAGFTPAKPDEPLPEGIYYMGDADLKGGVTATDALLVLRHVVGLTQLSGISLVLADMDSAGGVTASDALAILRTVVGLEPVRTVSFTEETEKTEISEE